MFRHSSPLLDVLVIIENVLSDDFVLSFFKHVLQVEYFSHSSYVLFRVVVFGDEAVRCAKFLLGIGRRSGFFGSFASGIVWLFGLGSWELQFCSDTVAFDFLQLYFLEILLALCLFEIASGPSLIFGLCEAGIMLCQIFRHRTKGFFLSIVRRRFWMLRLKLIYLRSSSQTI